MFRRILTFTLIFAFIGSSVPVPKARAAQLPLPLPTPGQMVPLSPAFTPAHLVGITIHPENALQFDFLIHKGDQPLDRTQKSEEYKNLVKYFLASLTIPDQDQWVNLSPYEKDRIIKQDFGQTEMGRDLLAQDYILKQITASLINPQEALGRQFWDRVYAQAHQQFGTTAIPVNTFNKVWVVPDSALVYEKGDSAYILQSHLKVMLEEDYLSLQKHQKGVAQINPHDGVWYEGMSQKTQPIAHIQSADELVTHLSTRQTNELGSQVVREIVLPQLEHEVNEGANFAQLRQIYSGMILATWYKKTLKDSLLGRIYADKDKVKGVDQNPKNNELIYQQYLKAFKKGVFNFIKEDVDKYTNQPIPRKYFSGGFHNTLADGAMTVVRKISVDFKLDESWKVDEIEQATVDLRGDQEPGIPIGSNTVAMTTTGMKGWDLFQNLLQRQWNPLTVRLTVGQKTYYVKATKNNFVQIKSLFLDEKLQIINGRGVGRLIAVDGHLPENLDVVEIPTGSQAVNLFENLLNKNSAPGSVKMIIGAEQRVVKGTSMNFNLIKEYLDPTTNAPAQLGFSNSGPFIGLVALNDTAPKGIEFADTAMTAVTSRDVAKFRNATLPAADQNDPNSFWVSRRQQIADSKPPDVLNKAAVGVLRNEVRSTHKSVDALLSDPQEVEKMIKTIFEFSIKSGLPQRIELSSDAVDKALTSTPGGIDFNAANLNLQIKRDGNGVPLPLVQQDMNQLMQINGFVPVIIEIQPVMNLPFLSQSQT